MTVVRTLESPEHKRALLREARLAAEGVLGLSPSVEEPPPRIEGRFGGVFVTFWSGPQLRGCVGTFAPTENIVQTIREVTRQSLADSRFQADPVSAEELEGLDIEVSVLSDLEPTLQPASLIPGTHGVVVRRGSRTGCFLPKVAAERGWSAEEFLSHCCEMKAGLPADAWRSPEAEVLLFTADAFSESLFRD